MSTWTKRRIEKRLGGYRQIINTVQSDGLERPESERKVAVVGGGLAGLAAAYSLAERGFKVDVYEAAGHLGGKCGAWPHTLKNGDEVWVEHGFHAVFRQYYNCRELFERTGVSRSTRVSVTTISWVSTGALRPSQISKRLRCSTFCPCGRRGSTR